MKRDSTVLGIMLLLAPLAWCQTPRPEASTALAAEAKPAVDESAYMRILRDEYEEPTALQTSVVSFRHRDDAKRVVVDLIGAVHVADPSYYRQLNRRFAQYDALLYELIAPEHSNVPVDGRSQHPIGQTQQGLKTLLELSYQLEEIDYTKRNFVHADMSPDEFSQVMNERNESLLQTMLKLMGSALAVQGGRGSDADLLFAFFAQDRALRLKRAMAAQFAELDSTFKALESNGGSTLVGQRNRKALDVLSRELAKGKQRIGIFYGAGHLPDMEVRLAKRFGLYPDKNAIQWLTAWNMEDK